MEICLLINWQLTNPQLSSASTITEFIYACVTYRASQFLIFLFVEFTIDDLSYVFSPNLFVDIYILRDFIITHINLIIEVMFIYFVFHYVPHSATVLIMPL